jgi:hypothetical protein
MQVVDRIASSGYSYVSPTVDRACKVVPLLGGIKERIEPYAQPLIQSADKCVDTVCVKVIYFKDVAYKTMEETGDKAQKMIAENVVVLRVQKTSLAIVDHLDMLVDRYLPEPESKEGKEDSSSKPLALRMIHIPLKIPVRIYHITIVKARGGYDAIQVQITKASELTSEQKDKLMAFIFAKKQAMTDKISTSTSSLAITLGALQQTTMDRASQFLVIGSQGLYDATSFVLGKDRATGVFTVVGKRLPFVKVGIPSSASTGALSDSSSHEVELKIQPSTGTTGKGPAPSTEKEKHVEKQSVVPELKIPQPKVAEIEGILSQDGAQVKRDLEEEVGFEDVKTDCQTSAGSTGSKKKNAKAKTSTSTGSKKK